MTETRIATNHGGCVMNVFPRGLFLGAAVSLWVAEHHLERILPICPVIPISSLVSGTAWAAAHGKGPSVPDNYYFVDCALIMQIIISLVLLGATLFIILAKKYQPKDKHWAYGTLGMVVGFWLK
jgi:hypothetical protein